jgi:hypothetical protein
MLNNLKRALLIKVINDVLKDKVSKMPKDWKTTALGVLGIVSALTGAATAVLQGHSIDWAQLFMTVTALSSGLGLIKAADSRP